MTEEGSTSNQRSVAGDEGSTLSGVIAAYAAEGFDGGFRTTPESRLECGSCLKASEPAEFIMSSMRRLEGASDPDDMLAVAAVTCPHCGQKGIATLGYGPASAPEDGDVLRALDDRRGDAGLPADSAPGETTGDHPGRS